MYMYSTPIVPQYVSRNIARISRRGARSIRPGAGAEHRRHVALAQAVERRIELRNGALPGRQAGRGWHGGTLEAIGGDQLQDGDLLRDLGFADGAGPHGRAPRRSRSSLTKLPESARRRRGQGLFDTLQLFEVIAPAGLDRGGIGQIGLVELLDECSVGPEQIGIGQHFLEHDQSPRVWSLPSLLDRPEPRREAERVASVAPPGAVGNLLARI
jgi:hypothetical protein